MIDKTMTRLPYNMPGAIYRSPLPMSPLFDPMGQLLDAFIQAGVDTVVMLTPHDEVWDLTGLDLVKIYQARGLRVVHAPVEDFCIPEGESFKTAINETIQAAQEGQTIVVHCHAGLGRTGMFAACLAKQVFDFDGPAAVDWVRAYIPGAVENQRQFRFVDQFH